MEIADLKENEYLALVALLDNVGAADRKVSEEEEEQFTRVISAMGEPAYRKSAEYVAENVRDEDDLRALLAKVTRQEARELIYATVMEAAMSEVVGEQEAPILEWLSDTWNLRP